MRTSFTTLALVLAVAPVIARAMQLEILRDPFEVTMHGESIARGPGAATSVILDLLCCLPAIFVLARRAFEPDFPIRTTLAHLLLFMLAAWTMATTIWASDKFAAAVNASHFVSAAVLMWSVSQLVREWWQVRLIAGVCFGLLLVYTAHGLIYRFVDLPAMRESVEENWPRILQQRGWEEGSFEAVQFKKKVLSGEMIGFGASPNTFAAMLVMLGIVSAGTALQRIRDRDEWGWSAAVGLSLLPAIAVLWMTQSRTAIATPILAVIMLVIAWNAREWLHRRRILAYIACIVALFIAIAAIVGHGIAHGTLFHDSLTFRWRYWVGAFDIFRAHPLLGVGFDNFASYYLGVRLPIASEEVRDPHNFIVRFFVETGAIGGIILLAWLARLWWEMTASLPLEPASDMHITISPLRMVGLIVGAAVLVNIVSAVDLAQPGSFVFIESMKRLLFGGLLLIGVVIGSFRSSRQPMFDTRPAPLLLFGVVVAIAIFVVHNLIDFSMFETGPMFVMMLLVGAVIGVRTPDRVLAPSRMRATASLAIASGFWVLFAVGFVAPIVAAETVAQDADDSLRAGQPAAAAAKLRDAFSLLWLPNADYPRRAARAMMYAGAAPDEVRQELDLSIATDPMAISARRLRANYELSMRSPDMALVILDFERLLQLNPNDVDARIVFAHALARFGQPMRAAAELHTSLEFNDRLAPDEPKRLSAARVDELRREIEKLSSGQQ